MNEVKIQIPDNCELIKDGDTYIVREKKQKPPRSWKEFCEKYPVKKGEAFIDCTDLITPITLASDNRNKGREGKIWCISKQEAEAFLALMQLRQLRKVWVGDWEQSKGNCCAGIFYSVSDDKVTISYDKFWTNITLSFPTKGMAEDFFNCFGCLCETAKPLL